MSEAPWRCVTSATITVTNNQQRLMEYIGYLKMGFTKLATQWGCVTLTAKNAHQSRISLAKTETVLLKSVVIAMIHSTTLR